MTDEDPIDYPNAEPDGLGELKEIKRVPGMRKVAPKIQWGKQYEAMPIEKRLDRAQKVANAMNHAADILQIERNQLIGVCKAQDKKLKQAAQAQIDRDAVVHQAMTTANAEKQKLYEQIVAQQQEIKQLKRTVARLEEVEV